MMKTLDELEQEAKNIENLSQQEILQATVESLMYTLTAICDSIVELQDRVKKLEEL